MFIDLHCDTLLQLYLSQEKGTNLFQNSFAVDFSRLKNQRAIAQFFAIFMLPFQKIKELKGSMIPQNDDFIESQIFRMKKELEAVPGQAQIAKSWGELVGNRKENQLSVFLTLEDGRGIQGNMDNLRRYKDQGISLITLTWNEENCFGYPNSPHLDQMSKGLKPFGKEAIIEMNNLGIIIDISHLNDGGFWDVIRITEKPVVASHSNCRSLCDHPRNLTDEMIRALGENGGVQGVNFCPDFLVEPNPSRRSTIIDLVKHLKHMYHVGGSDLPALGTDFDGISGELEISHCGEMDRLFIALEKAGFSYEDMEKIAYKNTSRVIQMCCP